MPRPFSEHTLVPTAERPPCLLGLLLEVPAGQEGLASQDGNYRLGRKRGLGWCVHALSTGVGRFASSLRHSRYRGLSQSPRHQPAPAGGCEETPAPPLLPRDFEVLLTPKIVEEKREGTVTDLGRRLRKSDVFSSLKAVA